MMKFVRENKYAAMLFTVVRLYLGWEWMTAGWHKITGGFNAGGFLNGAVANPVLDKGTNELVYPTFTAFLENFAIPNVKLINVLIPWGEFLVGIGLLLGALTTAAMFFGLMMNFMFMFAGTVSTNPWMVLLGAIILAAGANAGKFGADYYLLPYLKHLFTNRRNRKKNPPAANPKVKIKHA
ncbi:DoxX family protein [Paenibacillus sp. MBLB2552]|uniref:DoxX family protein n=1 Tax=Paenibacillus mellifer TaxID=2937794 RepID=A0A9X1XZY2_9BACL|nr:DoxX family protein [Paenibacillus mellifer]MCK8487046.1 DoxX family protein [Paenibacillus mellifer]